MQAFTSAKVSIAAHDGVAVESDLAYHPGELLTEEIEYRGLSQTALAEAMRIGRCASPEICRIRRVASSPSITGMLMSMRTISGRCSAYKRIASAPSVASQTSSVWGVISK